MIDYDYIVFQWDKQKDVSNLLKHGISFAVAHRAFFDKNAATHLASMPDTAIDTSDDWESQENVLDDDVLSWLSQQDSNTKQAINTMIRRVMAVQHV